MEKANWQKAFLGWLEEDGRGAKTILNYESDLAVLVSWWDQVNGEVFDPRQANRMDYGRWREWHLGKGRLSPATWNRRRSMLVMLTRWSWATGILSAEFDPLKGVLAAKAEKVAARWMTKTEYGRVMRQLELDLASANTDLRRARAKRDGALVAVMVYGGLRVDEACSLTKKDVQITERRGRLVVLRGKGDKYREVPLNSEARHWLSEWMAIGGNGETLFDVDVRMAEKIVKGIRERAGVEDLTPHGLRHTCAKRMVDAGRPLTEVKEILGHEKLETTARYCLPGWEDLEGAVESIMLGHLA